MHRKWRDAAVVAVGCAVMAIGASVANENGHMIAGTLAVAVPVTLAMCAINRDWWPFIRRR